MAPNDKEFLLGQYGAEIGAVKETLARIEERLACMDCKLSELKHWKTATTAGAIVAAAIISILVPVLGIDALFVASH